MSGENIAPVITAIGSALAAIGTTTALVLGIIFKRNSERRDAELAEKAEQVKEKLEETTQQNIQQTQAVADAVADNTIVRAIHQKKIESQLHGLKQVTDETHELTNGGMTLQLETNAISARALAELTKLSKYNKLAAEADRRLAEHISINKLHVKPVKKDRTNKEDKEKEDKEEESDSDSNN